MLPSHVPAYLCVLSDAELLGPPTMLLLLTNPPSHDTLSCGSLPVCAV